MRALLVAAGLLTLWAAPAAAGPGPGPGGIGIVFAPEVPKGRIAEYESNLRLLGKKGAWEPMAEAAFRWETERLSPYKALTLGSYRRVHRNLKLGAFYRVQLGARHDEDWIEEQNPPFWRWRDTATRGESVFLLDATPRVQLRMLPGEDWILALRTQYQHNAYFGKATAVVGPELTYHLMSGLSPLASLSLQYQAYLPLNYGKSALGEQWIYLAGLWHASPALTLGPQVALREWTFSSRPEFERNNGVVYRTTQRSLVWGFNLVWRPGRR